MPIGEAEAEAIVCPQCGSTDVDELRMDIGYIYYRCKSCETTFRITRCAKPTYEYATPEEPSFGLENGSTVSCLYRGAPNL